MYSGNVWCGSVTLKQLTQKSSSISAESHAWRHLLGFGTCQNGCINHNKAIFWLVFINLTQAFFSLPLVKTFGFKAEKEFFSCNSEYCLIVPHKMWAGEFTFWFGSWQEVSKSLTSEENINWPLEFLFFTLFWNCSAHPFTLSKILAMTLNVRLWKKHMIPFFSEMSTTNIATPRKTPSQGNGSHWLWGLLRPNTMRWLGKTEGNMLKTFAGLENNWFNNSRWF